MRRNVQHPGALLACFLNESEVSQNRLARAMGVPPRRINEILHGKRGISADTALGLSEIFGNDPGFWMRLQNAWELERARLQREARPRRGTRDLGYISLDYLVLLPSGKYGTGFQEWLEQHHARMKQLERGTPIHDSTDPEADDLDALDAVHVDPD